MGATLRAKCLGLSYRVSHIEASPARAELLSASGAVAPSTRRWAAAEETMRQRVRERLSAPNFEANQVF